MCNFLEAKLLNKYTSYLKQGLLGLENANPMLWKWNLVGLPDVCLEQMGREEGSLRGRMVQGGLQPQVDLPWFLHGAVAH